MSNHIYEGWYLIISLCILDTQIGVCIKVYRRQHIRVNEAKVVIEWDVKLTKFIIQQAIIFLYQSIVQ